MGLKIEDNCYVHNLLFADDRAVITRGVEDANYTVRKLEEKYEKWGFKINYGKTEYLGTDHSDELQINGNTIPTVKQFKIWDQYFKRMTHLTLTLKKGLVKQEEFYGVEIFSLNKVINIQPVLKSILTFGAETWSIKWKQTLIISHRNGLFKVFSKDVMNG
jgi:hypothetical protein